MQQHEKSRSHRSATQRRSPAKVQYALDLEAAMSAFEVKLNEERICENAVSYVVQTIRDFYDADCVLVIAVNPQSLTLRCIHKIYRDGFVSSIVEAMIVPGSRELVQEMLQIKAFTKLDVRKLAKSNERVYRNLVLAGFDIMLAVPYGISNHGLLVVCNPRKYAAYSSLLCMTSYIIGAELMTPRNSVHTEHIAQIGKASSDNEVYVKLLDGFELHTQDGIMTEEAIKRKQGVVFLVLLLFHKGQLLRTGSLLNSLWDDPDLLTNPERTLRNLGYSVRKSIGDLFSDSDFLEIHKSGFSINRKYNITTDFDRFVFQIREADLLSDCKAKLERYMEALDSFKGIVLPRHNSKAIDRIAAQYRRKRVDVQNTALSLMHGLHMFERMHELIDHASIGRGWDKDLSYWDIKAKMGLQMVEEAKKVFLANKEKFSDLQLTELNDLA